MLNLRARVKQDESTAYRSLRNIFGFECHLARRAGFLYSADIYERRRAYSLQELRQLPSHGRDRADVITLL